MGWASGSRLMSDLIESVKDNVESYESRVDLYIEMIHNFEDADCDTLNECLGSDPAFDEAWNRCYPENIYAI